jgi:hypothetical protein
MTEKDPNQSSGPSPFNNNGSRNDCSESVLSAPGVNQLTLPIEKSQRNKTAKNFKY